jgi:hypothetical protein
MTNNANNLTPTGPGYHYRSGRIVLVATNLATNLYSGLVYCEIGSAAVFGVEDDGLWRGPVPEYGEWVAWSQPEWVLSRADELEAADTKRGTP